MRAETVTKLPLWRFFQIMGVSTIHAAGLQLPPLGDNDANNVLCEQGLVQMDWQQADRVSREQIARYIRDAEDQIEEIVGYRLIPSWEADERVHAPTPSDPLNVYAGFGDFRGMNKAVHLKWKHFVSPGVKATTLIEAEADITWDTAEDDGWIKYGSVTVTTSVTEECEIRAFYPGHNGDPAWEIRPISVTIADGEATIRVRRELCMVESQMELRSHDVDLLDGRDDDNFLDKLAVYRVWNDPQTQVSFLWEPARGYCQCGARHDVYATGTGFLVSRDDRRSFVGYSPGTWNADDDQFDIAGYPECRGEPNQMRAYYLAGYQDKSKACPRVEMDDRLARLVAILAASKTERPLCACIEDKFAHWTQDMSKQGGREVSFNVRWEELSNPLGATRGALMVWRTLTNPLSEWIVGRGPVLV